MEEIAAATKVVDKPLVPATFRASAAAQTSAASPFAKFKMRADSSESDSETTGSALFSRWKQSKQEANNESTTRTAGGTSTAAAIRDSSASPAALLNASSISGNKARFSPATTTKKTATAAVGKKITPIVEEGADDRTTNDEATAAPEQKDRNRRAILYESDDEKPNERLDKKLNHDRRIEEQQQQREKAARKPAAAATAADVPRARGAAERTADKFRDFLGDDAAAASQTNTKTMPIAQQQEVVVPVSRKRTLSPSVSGPVPPTSGGATETPPKKTKVIEQRAAAEPEKTAERSYKPFKRLLEGVVLVISGIQNPGRGQIRDKALAMGAKYKPDWDANCTHLM